MTAAVFNTRRMVLQWPLIIEPVTELTAINIKRLWLTGLSVVTTERDQFFQEVGQHW